MDKIKSRHSFGDYIIELSKTNDHLFIEIEVPSSGRTYFVELDNDVVSQVSQEIFPNVDTMFQGLEEAINKTFKEVSLTFNGSGKLTYKVGFSVGPIQKDHQFTIDLQEKDIDALTMFEKRVENRFEMLSQKISNFENQDHNHINGEKIALHNGNDVNQNGDSGKRLEILEKRVFERFDMFEKKIISIEETKVSRAELQNVIDALNKLEHRVHQPNPLANEPNSDDLIFALPSKNAKDVEFLSNGKIIQYVGNRLAEVPLSKSLPKNGVFKLNLKLMNAPRHIWFGIVDQELMNDTNSSDWFYKNYFYSTKDGSLWQNNNYLSKMKNSNENKGKTGDVLSFIIDVEREIFSVQVNGIEINSAKISLQNKTYFPYCGLLSGLLSKHCQVSII